MYRSFVLTIVVLNATLVISDTCNTFKTCGGCIGNTFKCVWCSAENHDEPRCQPSSIIANNESWCQGSISNPKLSFNLDKDEHFASVTKNTDEENKNKIVQFKPQNIRIKARPGDSISFKMSYKPAKDYPLDIYYLMDGSYTMWKYRDRMVERAINIYETLKNITNNVRFGAGSFIEKFALPYAKLKLPGYDFKNRLSLTKDINQFVDVVKNIDLTGNSDIQEAGLDALMQVMVCGEIKWRLNEARCIIILSTDAPYHSAGDGKVVGAAIPNDMKCHLKDGMYDEISLINDYPSVSQINKVAAEKQMKIIFASINSKFFKDTKAVYDALAKKVGANSVELSKDIVDMIKDEYLALVQNLEIRTFSVPPSIDIKLDPPCDENNKCTIEHGKSFDINATLHVKSCPSDNKYEHNLEIGPFGIHERLAVNIIMDCQCECEKDGKVEVNSTKCSRNGIYQCGVCKCNENRYGKMCECSGSSTEENDFNKCKMNDGSNPCSGRGKCRCGTCECEPGFSGLLCQFGEYECPFFNGKLCGGNGKCTNNTCECHNGWTGDICSCTTDKSLCFGANSQICSGNGDCACGKCKCTAIDSKNNNYTGPFCNWCEGCQNERCLELQDYVECYYNNEKAKCDKKFGHVSNHEIKMLNKTEIKTPEWQKLKGYWCKKVLDDGSAIVFKFIDRHNYTLILIQKEKEIPPKADILIPVAIAIGAILLIGLLTVLAWKFLVDLHDEREYKKFAQEAASSGFEVTLNPYYENPVTNIANPAYCGN